MCYFYSCLYIYIYIVYLFFLWWSQSIEIHKLNILIRIHLHVYHIRKRKRDIKIDLCICYYDCIVSRILKNPLSKQANGETTPLCAKTTHPHTHTHTLSLPSTCKARSPTYLPPAPKRDEIHRVWKKKNPKRKRKDSGNKNWVISAAQLTGTMGRGWKAVGWQKFLFLFRSRNITPTPPVLEALNFFFFVLCVSSFV